MRKFQWVGGVMLAISTSTLVYAEEGSGTVRGNAFNPDISLILMGRYAYLTQDPTDYRINGFVPGGEVGPPPRGFGLGESELGFYANVDPRFYGGLNLALAPDNGVSVEEAYFQTLALAPGLTLRGGRFFSGIGYLNERHAHTWDFADNPLSYQVFLETQFAQEGLQLKWLAPLERYLEVGAEIGNGRGFPASDAARNDLGSGALYAHTGGDVGDSHSWRAGASWLAAWPRARAFDTTDITGAQISNRFSGTSHLAILDAVWKWAPQGNAVQRNVILQGEYFMRRERGDLSSSAVTSAYTSAQSGGYVQALFQFVRYWRVGARAEQLESGQVDFGALASGMDNTRYRVRKYSVMIDFSPSEFSRLRLQLARDGSRANATDNQLVLHYQMSLGAHGAHTF